MQVPNSWWKGYKKDNERLNARTIVGVNLDAPQSNYFQLECISKIYAMQYDAVYLYVDVNHVDYRKFTLPPDAPANPANKDEVIAPVQKKRNKNSTWRLDNNDDNDNDNDNDNDDYFATPKKRYNNAGKRKHKKMKETINHDFVLGAEFGNEGTADVENEEGGDNDMDDDDGPMGEPPKKYGMTMAKDWTMHTEGGGPPIEPVPYTGNSELFWIKLADGDLDKMCDKHGAIRFHKVFEWIFPTFGKMGFYKFIAARMQNYMIPIIQNDAFKPAHFDPFDEKYISADNVARFFGCQLGRAIKGLPSVDNCWSTREALDAVRTAKENMPCGAFPDMQQCMYVTDDWEENKGDVWTSSTVPTLPYLHTTNYHTIEFFEPCKRFLSGWGMLYVTILKSYISSLGLFILICFCDVIFSLMTVYIFKKMCCQVTWWWCGSAYIVVDGSVLIQNYYFLSCRMYELIQYMNSYIL